jgi:hypothetical protein
MTDFETLHGSLAEVAKGEGCTKSVLTPGHVSVHTLPQTASFSNVEALFQASKTTAYVATVGENLVFSACLGPKEARGGKEEGKGGAEEEEEEEEDVQSRPAKRRRDTSAEEADRVANARSRLAKAAPALPSEQLDVAQRVLTRLVKDLRGPNGEIVVQSYAILSKKLGVADSQPRVVVAARLNAGIELRVELLKSCLGACWADGLLTTHPMLHGIGKLELPLSEEASAAAFFGNASVLLVTSVPSK